MKNATEIFLLLDASSSMGPLTSTTIEAVNSFISDQKAQPGEAYLTIAQFNQSSRIVAEGNLATMNHIGPDSYKPNGMTALADALITHIDGLGKKLANLNEADRPDKIVFVIVTDGEENASENLMESATIKIKHQEEVYNWKFLYLAAGKDAFAQGHQMKFDPNQIVSYLPTADSSKAVYAAVSSSVAQYRSSGVAASLNLDGATRNKILGSNRAC